MLNWVGNILFFMVFLTVAEHILPGKKYNRYLRLPAGMILILLVLKPVTGGLQLDEQIIRYFEAASFRQEAQDLSKDILGIEQQRLDQVISNYEQMVESNINTMAREEGVALTAARAEIERDRDNPRYGMVVFIQMEVEDEKEEEGNAAVQTVNLVEPIKIDLDGLPEERPSKESDEAKEKQMSKADKGVEQLRRKVESYYGLETGEVEIKVKRK